MSVAKTTRLWLVFQNQSVSFRSSLNPRPRGLWNSGEYTIGSIVSLLFTPNGSISNHGSLAINVASIEALPWGFHMLVSQTHKRV